MLDSLHELRARFVYKTDQKDRWTLLQGNDWCGDCEDFALTALWLLAGGSWLRLWWWVLTCQAMLWKADTPNGPHVMLWVKGMGWIDNWYPTWNQTPQHRRVWPYVAPALAITLLLK